MTVDLKELAALKDAGYISTQHHPSVPLLVHNYTPRCQYDGAWNDLTLSCRGLITDESGNVIARPFRKFFNVGEHEKEGSNLPPINWNQPFYVSEKMDGSLGILFPCLDGKQAIATRGSFISDQAFQATMIWMAKYDSFEPLPGHTYLFEILYPENRIVVDYGQTRDLFLLEIIDNTTGDGVPPELLQSESERIGCPLVKHLRGLTADILTSYDLSGDNREGIVVRFADGMRVKIKLEEYKRLHRLITGVTARMIWESLSTGKDIDLDRVPDEFFDWVTQQKRELGDKFDVIKQRSQRVFSEILEPLPSAVTRKEIALEFLKHKDICGILFTMLDKKDADPAIWKMIYPEHSVPWKCGES